MILAKMVVFSLTFSALTVHLAAVMQYVYADITVWVQV